MAWTASKLRENVYKVLDQVLETGEPVEIVRRGRMLRIEAVGAPKKRKLADLPKRPDALLAAPETLVHLDWSKEWQP